MGEQVAATPKKSGRGGARPGAGRKPKGHVKPSALGPLTLAAAVASEPPAEIDGVAQRHARDAIGSLVRLLAHGSSEAAKITAAKELLDRGYGKPAVEIGGDAAPMLPFMMAPAPSAISLGEEIRAEARRYATLAIETLRRIAQDGQSETAIASASNKNISCCRFSRSNSSFSYLTFRSRLSFGSVSAKFRASTASFAVFGSSASAADFSFFRCFIKLSSGSST